MTFKWLSVFAFACLALWLAERVARDVHYYKLPFYQPCGCILDEDD